MLAVEDVLTCGYARAATRGVCALCRDVAIAPFIGSALPSIPPTFTAHVLHPLRSWPMSWWWVPCTWTRDQNGCVPTVFWVGMPVLLAACKALMVRVRRNLFGTPMHAARCARGALCTCGMACVLIKHRHSTIRREKLTAALFAHIMRTEGQHAVADCALQVSTSLHAVESVENITIYVACASILLRSGCNRR